MPLTIGIAFIITSLLYSISLNILFFSKKHINNYETKLFSVFLPSNLFGLLLEFCCTLSIYCYGIENNISILLSKFFLVYLLFFGLLLILYVYIICGSKDTVVELNNKQKLIKNIFIIIIFISSIITLLLPIELKVSNGSMYSSGLATMFVYGISGIAAIYCIIMFFYSIKTLKKKKYIPLIVYVIGSGIMTVIQQKFPEFTIATSIETLVIFLMYHTIENPDIKMVQQLEIAKDSAEKANRAKTDFLSSMSHEIRTPLNAIVGFSDCIMESNNLEEAKENAKDIVNASNTLLEIVNGILDISKIEAGKLEITNSKYDARNTFEELAKLITPKMQEKGLDFTYSIAEDLPETLFGDHANIKKIITNLLSNACKYTSTGFVRYEVNCVNVNGICKLIISVEDSGRGIKKENVDKLFTKFQRLDEDRNTTIEGTGLGLAITKQLVELMGGRIVVHTIYGEGSKFTVLLNQKIETGRVEEVKKVKQPLDLENIKILMVDDTPLNLKVACKLLEKYHANQITTCNSGFECIERIQRGEKYDIILLDDMMPKMSGVITLQKLKEIPTFHIPTVALTANAITGMREKYLKDGFDDYLAKPIEKEQLVRVLNQILGRTPTEDIRISNDEEKVSNEVIPVEDTSNELIPVVDINQNLDKKDRKYLEEQGVDVTHALELLGDMDMYNITIQDFLKDVEEKWNRIVEYKNSSNLSEYSVEVHSLKSDCKYLGFMTLADICYQHELKSKENDLDFVLNHFQELEEEYQKVLKIAKEYVDDIS